MYRPLPPFLHQLFFSSTFTPSGDNLRRYEITCGKIKFSVLVFVDPNTYSYTIVDYNEIKED